MILRGKWGADPETPFFSYQTRSQSYPVRVRTAFRYVRTQTKIVGSLAISVTMVLRGKLKEGKFGEGSNLKQGSSQEGFAAGISEFNSFADDSGHELENIKSELDIYLGEPRYKFPDCLEWWKVNSPKYLILSKMAQDILAIPVTNVASESAFSAGGRVIEPHLACLKPETLQVLLCGGDWARELNMA
ncbi:hypothetical protein OROMI_020219 [Orobanche minor]